MDDWSAYSVSSTGDVNGDGLDDILIGAYRGAPNGNSQAGETYLVYGRADTAGIPGDFDSDGDVDGADFLMWQRGEISNPPNQSELDDWQEHFGTVASSITPASASVPEPTTGLMLMFGMAALLTARRTGVSKPIR